MKSTYIRMWAVIISALGVLACTADEQTLIVSDEDVVRLSADISGVVTRVNYEGTAFNEGDVISVKNLSSEVNNLARYRYNSAYDTWGMLEDGTNVLLWNGTGDNDFAAWYPDHASYDGFEIPSDQTDGYLMADWMTARTVARKSDKILSLSFAHHLSKVEVNVVRWGDMLPEDQGLSGLSVLSLSGKMTNDGQEVTGDNSQMYVAAELSGVASAVAVVAPGTYASGSDFLKVSCVDGGKTLSYAVKLYDDVEMVPGKCYSFDLIVGKLGVSVSNVSVADWDDMELGQVAAEDAYLHVDTPDTQKIGFEGGDIVIPARSNLNFAIECPDWITYQGAVSDGDMENLTFTGLKLEFSFRPSTYSVYFVFTEMKEGAYVNNVTLDGNMNIYNSKDTEFLNLDGDKRDNCLYGGYETDAAYEAENENGFTFTKAPTITTGLTAKI